MLIWVATNITWGKEHWRDVMQVDACGYYAWLPSLILYDDPEFRFCDTLHFEADPDRVYNFRVEHDGHKTNKYFVGTAIAEAPFFLAAHAYALLTGTEATGYSKPYALAIGLAAICYALLGLWALDRLLRTWPTTNNARMLALVAILFGTNLFYYTIVAPGMSHVYSFFFCTFFLLLARRWMLKPKPGLLVVMAMVLGMVVLIRPVNAMVVLALPFLAGDRSAFGSAMRKAGTHWRMLLIAMACFAVVAGVQPLLYYRSTGSWFVDTYPGEGFNWSDPHPIDILFSYRKGLFVYTPLLLFSTLLAFRYWWRDRQLLTAWAGFFLVITYILSSWWSWWYGGGSSGRPYVEFLAWFAIPLALGLSDPGAYRQMLRAVVVVLVLVCQAQTYQVRYYRIDTDNMDRARYWEEFLRVDRIGQPRTKSQNG